VGDEVYSLMQGLYYSEDSARAILLTIGFPPAAIPAFKAAATFWPETVLKLRHGVIENGVVRLLEAVCADHPANAEARRLLAVEMGRAAADAHAASTGPAGKGPVSVLCLLSDPTQSLRIDQEARLIQRIADGGGLKLRIQYATRNDDIIRAIRTSTPGIIHFGGHGSTDGRLWFEDEAGTPADVSLAALASAIAAVTEGLLDCVVLNSCFSARGAAAFRGVTRAVAGSVTGIRDDCALAFAEEFYTEIAAGQSVRRAFDAGRASAQLRNCETWGFHYEPFGRPEGGPNR
jgi:CHAT domain/Effector-associated domain 1